MKTSILLVVAACAATPSLADSSVAAAIQAKTRAELSAYESTTTNDTGTARFDFKGNDGVFTIKAGKSTFETKWSSCGKDAVYAYKDRVDLVGWNEGQTEFPDAAEKFTGWDWKRRVVDAKKGSVVAFMGKDGKICAVKIVNVSDRDRGAEIDELQIEYRVY